MPAALHHNKTELQDTRSRLRAVLLFGVLVPVLTLAGCSSRGASPLSASLQAALPGIGGPDVARQAQALPYASLSVDIHGNQGLLVLGTQAGASTYWQSRDQATLVLAHGGLSSTGGLPEDVLSSHYRPVTNHGASAAVDFVPWHEAAPLSYRLGRSWRNAAGHTEHQQAQGQFHCAPAARVELPLQTRLLERCELAQTWADGETTADVVWRDPLTYRVWAAQMTPWPGQRAFTWQVARPWWASSAQSEGAP